MILSAVVIIVNLFGLVCTTMCFISLKNVDVVLAAVLLALCSSFYRSLSFSFGSFQLFQMFYASRYLRCVYVWIYIAVESCVRRLNQTY